jgi:hypothetical protein
VAPLFLHAHATRTAPAAKCSLTFTEERQWRVQSQLPKSDCSWFWHGLRRDRRDSGCIAGDLALWTPGEARISQREFAPSSQCRAWCEGKSRHYRCVVQGASRRASQEKPASRWSRGGAALARDSPRRSRCRLPQTKARPTGGVDRALRCIPHRARPDNLRPDHPYFLDRPNAGR